MKTLKINFGAAALVLGLIVAVGTSAFTPAKTISKWHLIEGKTFGDINDAGNYEASTEEESCNDVPVVPCVVQFDTGSYSSLQDYLDNVSDETLMEESSTRSE